MLPGITAPAVGTPGGSCQSSLFTPSLLFGLKLQVDAYELAVETPPAARAEAAAAPSASSPPRAVGQPGIAQALAAAAPTPGTALCQRPMSLGLSRRRSSMAPWAAHTVLASATKAQPSPLKLAVPRDAAEGW